MKNIINIVIASISIYFKYRFGANYMVTRRVTYLDGVSGTATFYFRTRDEAVKMATSFKAKHGRSSVSVVHQCFYTITNSCPLPMGLFTAYN